jgi:hypothetical protein
MLRFMPVIWNHFVRVLLNVDSTGAGGVAVGRHRPFWHWAAYVFGHFLSHI